ncbi:hypothetical protein E6O75_ATG07341 [Venturia nashicola]|uniref:Uncharacterized protein n=1 Tax=Venturia nashicola TaxID=86259 RepID=A0A4Z1NFK3_9PEZI|nr:hypothetical protein E6O75_ATG07341 [Venturia nashicola]
MPLPHQAEERDERQESRDSWNEKLEACIDSVKHFSFYDDEEEEEEEQADGCKDEDGDNNDPEPLSQQFQRD